MQESATSNKEERKVGEVEDDEEDLTLDDVARSSSSNETGKHVKSCRGNSCSSEQARMKKRLEIPRRKVRS